MSSKQPAGDEHLASDKEREHVAAWLGVALEEGRLSLAEYERRTVAAYAATTRGDLTLLTADLPFPGQSEVERRMSSADKEPHARVAYPPSRVAPHLAVGAVAFIGGAVYGRFVGSLTPLICLVVTVLVVGGLGWVYWDPYGHKGRRD